jgi:Ca-activated chloride channel family protein
MKKLLSLLILAVLPWLGTQAQASPSVAVSVEYPQATVAPGQPVEVVIRFKAASVSTVVPLSPLNLSLVIDCSGSMQDEDKLAYAKLAAGGLVRRLGDRDQLAVISFGSIATTNIPLTRTRREQQPYFIDTIDSLGDLGGTDIYQGLEAGFAQLESGSACQALRRVILLSDGYDSGHLQLADLALAAKRRGITLSTMGMGQAYDEDLLQMLARRGGGHYYYIRHPEEGGIAFNREMNRMMAEISRGVGLKLTLAPKMDGADIYVYSVNQVKNGYQIDLNDFQAGEERIVVIKFEPRVATSGPLQLGVLELTYHDLVHDCQNVRQQIPLEVSVSEDETERIKSRNRQAQIEVISLLADLQYIQAIKLARTGQYSDAEKLAEDTKAHLASEAAALNSERLSQEMQSMEVLPEHLATLEPVLATEREGYAGSDPASSSQNIGKSTSTPGR